MSAYRPEFEAALRLLARISRAMDEAGHRPPVLVGGAAVEIYTRGAVTTGDFDLSCTRQDILEAEMQLQGFVRPSGPGMATRGWIHPELKLGFECVSDILLDGLADRSMIQVVSLGEDGDIAVIAPEDIIADRMGQYASGSAPDMLGQARALFAFCEGLDLAYEFRGQYTKLGIPGAAYLLAIVFFGVPGTSSGDTLLNSRPSPRLCVLA